MIDLLGALRGLFVQRDGHAAAVRAVVELIDGSALASDVDDALRHVETCPACRHEVAEFAPVVLGLRRFGRAMRAEAGPTPDGWSRLSRLLPVPTRRRTSFRQVVPALVAPLVVALALMPTIGVSRAAYETAAVLSETSGAVGSANAQPLRPAERPVDERANYDVLRWAGARDWAAGDAVTAAAGLRIPGVPAIGPAERPTQGESGTATDRPDAIATAVATVRGWGGR